MDKSKSYSGARFTPEVISEVCKLALASFTTEKFKPKFLMLEVQKDAETWAYDTLDEFLAEYRHSMGEAHFFLEFVSIPSTNGPRLIISVDKKSTNVTVRSETRAELMAIFDIFEAAFERCATFDHVKKKAEEKVTTTRPTIFIGHGRNNQWRDLKDHLQAKHGFQIEAYETGARAGYHIKDILQEMMNKSSFAILVLTAEDEQCDGKMRARQNVIHEVGLFQGRLGFEKAIMLLEDGVEAFTNVHGVQYIPFSTDNIKETFGEVLATVKREFEF